MSVSVITVYSLHVSPLLNLSHSSSVRWDRVLMCACVRERERETEKGRVGTNLYLLGISFYYFELTCLIESYKGLISLYLLGNFNAINHS